MLTNIYGLFGAFKTPLITHDGATVFGGKVGGLKRGDLRGHCAGIQHWYSVGFDFRDSLASYPLYQIVAQYTVTSGGAGLILWSCF